MKKEEQVDLILFGVEETTSLPFDYIDNEPFHFKFKIPRIHFRQRNRGSGNKRYRKKPKLMIYDKLHFKHKSFRNQPKMPLIKHYRKQMWKQSQGEL